MTREERHQILSNLWSGKNNPMYGKSGFENKTKEEMEIIGRKISESLKSKKLGKNLRKQVKCVETTEAWLSLSEFAKEKRISISYASIILKKGIYKNLHYKFI
ncbi:MAG: hypothetical protein LBD41_03090 [Clostridiales Family XIII bacterium]|jgi:hypothetical protein|nr:hypothetical protein [Clostridiales Family XIII bacterium]